MFASRSADNKLGVLVLAAVLKNLSGQEPDANLYFVSSVQEEIGLRGAITSTSLIKPDQALVLDVTHATDYPSVNKNIHGDIRLGLGAVLAVSPEIHPEINRIMKEISAKRFVTSNRSEAGGYRYRGKNGTGYRHRSCYGIALHTGKIYAFTQ